MNHNQAPRKKQSAGSSQASAAYQSGKEVPLIADDGGPLLTPEQHREIKMMEAANERRKIERLRAEAQERFAEERRSNFRFTGGTAQA